MSAFPNKSFSHYRCVEATLLFSAVAQRLQIEHMNGAMYVFKEY